ncbi:hypothetical protein BM527_15030 [Alteromonas sp. Mex14]|nr:hypothetical protein BM527_15030 [Alteromonas sp. Mex14]
MSHVVSKFVIHELVKGEDEPRLASELLDVTDNVINDLAEEILELFDKKTSVIYGIFTSHNLKFPKSIKSYRDCGNQNTDFLTTSQETMRDMQLAMKNTSGTGGYITFIEYIKQNATYVIAVMIKNTKAFELKELKPKEATRVDTTKLYQAININIDSFIRQHQTQKQEDLKSYISFVSKAGEPSGYFLDAFSCKANVTPAKATASAPKAARSFLLSVGVEKEKAKEAYYAVVDLLIESAEKPISISKIHRKVNEYLPENIYENTKDDFLAYAKNEEYQLPDTFQSKGTTARSLRQIKGEGEGWELNFDKDIIGLKGKDVDKSFMYDRDNDILYMPKIPSELKERIIQELGLGEGE